MKTYITNPKCFMLILVSLLIGFSTQIASSSTPATCEAGDVLAPGESCTYPDTDAVFSVLDNGNSKWNIPDFPFLNKVSVGGSISFTANINNVSYHFVAKAVANNSWEIEEIGDDTNQQADTAPSVSSEEIAHIVSLLSMDTVIFNEIFNASNDEQDWLELRNISDTVVDLTGWQLTLHTSLGSKVIPFPEDTLLPAGEVLLIVNTDPSVPGMPLSVLGERAVPLIVAENSALPQMDFALILQNALGGYEDALGNYFPNRLKPTTAPLLTVDTAWYRAKPAVLGYQTEAWVASGYRNGIGYDDGVPAEMALGTPGYGQPLIADVNADGTVNILDLVLVASQFGVSDALPGADINGDGSIDIQDLVQVANHLGSVAAAPSVEALTAAKVETWVRLAQAEGSLPFHYHRGIEVLEELSVRLRPKTTALLPNYPNPFNPETWIPYRLAKASDVKVSIYDARGSIVRHLDLGHQAAGLYQTRNAAAYWDGRNEMGESVASGLYFYTLTAGDFTATRKMLIRK